MELNTKGLVTKVREIISDGTGLDLTSVVTPVLPTIGDNYIAITQLGGTPTDNLCEVEYYDFTFRALIRGTTNDTATRELADKVVSEDINH